MPHAQILELVLPVGFVCILLTIKLSLQDTDGFSPEIQPAVFPAANEAIIPLTFRDYVTSVQTPRFCFAAGKDRYVTGMLTNQNPFIKCEGTSCAKGITGLVDATENCEYLILAIAPKTATTRAMNRASKFANYTLSKYSDYNNTGHYQYPMIQMFDTEQAVTDYITSDAYGTGSAPKIAFAVVFEDSASETDYAYTLRLNSTNFNIAENAAQPVSSTTPPTTRKFSALAAEDDACALENGSPDQQRGNDASCTYQYMFNGAIAIQRLVNDWIHDDTGTVAVGLGVAEHGVQFVPFPTKEFVTNGFYAQINGKAASCCCHCHCLFRSVGR